MPGAKPTSSHSSSSTTSFIDSLSKAGYFEEEEEEDSGLSRPSPRSTSTHHSSDTNHPSSRSTSTHRISDASESFSQSTSLFESTAEQPSTRATPPRTKTTHSKSLSVQAERARHNQPKDYDYQSFDAPTYYYGKNHDYIYFPVSWYDEEGNYNRAGYYDEEGRYYKDVKNTDSSTEDGILIACPNCESTKLIKWSNVNTSELDLTCEKCGKQMEIICSLDETLGREGKIGKTDSSAEDKNLSEEIKENESINVQSEYKAKIMPTKEEATKPVLAAQKKNIESNKEESEEKSWAEKVVDGIAIVGILFMLGVVCVGIFAFIGGISEAANNSFEQQEVQTESWRNVHLRKRFDGTYRVTYGDNWDYAIVWDDEERAYYCEELNQWFDYNTDVTPHVWQYWQEDISGKYRHYGWMEYDAEGWWIEIEKGQWIKMPDDVDTSGLIHIEESEPF